MTQEDIYSSQIREKEMLLKQVFGESKAKKLTDDAKAKSKPG